MTLHIPCKYHSTLAIPQPYLTQMFYFTVLQALMPYYIHKVHHIRQHKLWKMVSWARTNPKKGSLTYIDILSPPRCTSIQLISVTVRTAKAVYAPPVYTPQYVTAITITFINYNSIPSKTIPCDTLQIQHETNLHNCKPPCSIFDHGLLPIPLITALHCSSNKFSHTTTSFESSSAFSLRNPAFMVLMPRTVLIGPTADIIIQHGGGLLELLVPERHSCVSQQLPLELALHACIPLQPTSKELRKLSLQIYFLLGRIDFISF